MFTNVVFSNAHFELIEENNFYFVRFLQEGFTINEFNQIMMDFPQLQLTEFVALKNAMTHVDGDMTKIGTKNPRIEYRISKDRMKAFLKLNFTDIEFDKLNKEDLVKEIINDLVKESVISGYDVQGILQTITLRKEYEVAMGRQPVVGEDAVIRYYEIKEPQPKLSIDGKVDHYELELINNIEKGDWVGERLEPTQGEVGKNVCGEIIPSRSGENMPLKYDPETIREVTVEEEAKTYLYAKKKGAVMIEDGRISVCNYLEIEGRVSFKTGNIDFDGFVGVTDTVEDNFSISAEKDIQVLGELGVGAVDFIESTGGNIYIKGGIAGKNKAKIVSSGNLYTKFAADCTIECAGTVNIGYYALNCHIKAKEVILESSKSKIMGGRIEADVKVVAAEIGNRNDMFTEIQINGFDKDEMKDKYDSVNKAIDQYNEKLSMIGKKIAVYKSKVVLSPQDKKERDKLYDLNDQLLKNLSLLKDNQKQFKSYISTKGEGEIRVTKQLYDHVKMRFKNTELFASPSKLAVTHYLSKNEVIVD